MRLVEGYDGEHPILDALPLRVMGAIHAEVLAGRAPDLAAFYPSAGGTPEAEGAWRALRGLVEARGGDIAGRIHPVQTNEVRRCCVLLPGFLAIAGRFGLPLRLLELGSSGGLNLGFDRYRYRLGPHEFGPTESPLTLECEWRGMAPPLSAPLQVASRAGCDPNPIDVRDPDMRRRLESFLWPEQTDRFARLRSAVAVARAQPPSIARAAGAQWLTDELAPLPAGQASVIFHSVVWWYIPEPEREAITRIIETAAREATPERPLAWLRMEGSSLKHAELRLRCWPDGTDVHLADCHWHGGWVEWLHGDWPDA